MAVVVKGAFAGVGGAAGNGSSHPNVWRREITCTEVRTFEFKFPITNYSESVHWVRLKGMHVSYNLYLLFAGATCIRGIVNYVGMSWGVGEPLLDVGDCHQTTADQVEPRINISPSCCWWCQSSYIASIRSGWKDLFRFVCLFLMLTRQTKWFITRKCVVPNVQTLANLCQKLNLKQDLEFFLQCWKFISVEIWYETFTN